MRIFESHRAKVRESLDKCARLLAEEAQCRRACFHQHADTDIVATHRSIHQTEDEDNELKTVVMSIQADADAPLHALDNLVSRRRAHGVAHVLLSHVEELPKYDTWVPVIHNFYVTESGVDPYIPYFGDRKHKIHMANECYREMLVDAKFRSARLPSDDLSDGEIHEEGLILSPRTEDDWYLFHAPEQARNRAAMRTTITSLVERYGKGDEVWRSLSFAFNIGDIRRLRHIFSLAERRSAEYKGRANSIVKTRTYSRQVRKAATMPQPETDAEILQRDGCAQGALRHFCFPCHQFGCHFHDDGNVAPVLPIPDHSADDRVRELKYHYGKIPPCSQTCFLLAEWKQVPVGPEEVDRWTPEELLLLREGVMMYKFDPCNLSILVGRTCREVHNRLRLSNEKSRLTRVLEQCEAPRRVRTNSTSEDRDVPLLGSGVSKNARPMRTSMKKKMDKRPSRAIKTAPNTEGANNEAEELQMQYRPCNHPGACTRKNSCDCALKDLSCEIYCGCNCGRWVEGLKGMRWDSPADTELKRGLAVECSRRFAGCRCRSGYCSTNMCLCYAASRVCNPDVCVSCDCGELPTKRSLEDRRCRNSAAITSRHKQTFMGKSKIHGYGLFAGDYFNRGDLVGLYCGRVMHTDLIEETLRAYQAKGMTYAFNLQDALTLDAGPVGSKAKFLNHCEGDEQNCFARVQRLRGDCIIVLRTSKPVAPGEELLFNYNIIGEGGNDWIMNGGDQRDSDSSEKSAAESSPELVASDDMDRAPLTNPHPVVLARIKFGDEVSETEPV